jgi:hypothetical protein
LFEARSRPSRIVESRTDTAPCNGSPLSTEEARCSAHEAVATAQLRALVQVRVPLERQFQIGLFGGVSPSLLQTD